MGDWWTKIKVKKTAIDCHDVEFDPLFATDLRSKIKLRLYENVNQTGVPRSWTDIKNAVNALSIGESKVYWCVVPSTEPPEGDVTGARYDPRETPVWDIAETTPPPLPSLAFRTSIITACSGVIALASDPEWVVALEWMRKVADPSVVEKDSYKTAQAARDLLDLLLEPMERLCLG